eukprot:372778-Prorocentrum_lima.AAC.1
MILVRVHMPCQWILLMLYSSMFKLAGFHFGIFPIMLLQSREEKITCSVCGSTIDVINVRGDEADRLRIESAMGA